MRRNLKVAGMLVVLAAVLVLAAVPVAQSAIYSTTYYNIHFYNSTQFGWAYYLASYLNRAFWAAKTTIGYDARLGKMNIYFSSRTDLGYGWMVGGYQNIWLSVPSLRSQSYEQWGSVVAHESAHILFYNYTRAHLWRAGMRYHRSFLTESLSWYCGDYVYYYYRNTKSIAYSHIRAHLKYYAYLTGGTMTWWGSGYYYHHGSGNRQELAIWSLRAAGWYLTGGRLTSSNPYLQRTLRAMRSYSAYSGRNLRSSTFSTAERYFETAFRYGYGRYANARCTFTGTSSGAYKNRSYLFGIFWYYFYS